MDVPLNILSCPCEVKREVMPTPGAKMSRHVPMLEYNPFTSFVSVEPTVMTLVAEAGDARQASLLAFPAATTTVIPAATALSTAEFIATFTRPPRLMLMTAPFGRDWNCAITQSIPAIMSVINPSLFAPKTLTAIKLAFLAIPYVLLPTVPKRETE
jgi:hypothetical protein